MVAAGSLSVERAVGTLRDLVNGHVARPLPLAVVALARPGRIRPDGVCRPSLVGRRLGSVEGTPVQGAVTLIQEAARVRAGATHPGTGWRSARRTAVDQVPPLAHPEDVRALVRDVESRIPKGLNDLPPSQVPRDALRYRAPAADWALQALGP